MTPSTEPVLAKERSPIGVIIAVCAGLSLITATAGAVYLISTGHNIGSFEDLEKLKKASGLIGVFVVLYAIIKLLLRKTDGSLPQTKEPSMQRTLLLLIASAIMSFASAYLSSGVQELLKQKRALSEEVAQLSGRRVDLLTFLGEVSKRENISLLHSSVDTVAWRKAIGAIEQLPPDRRKSTILRAILLSWKSVPFKLEGKTLSEGINSPSFIRHLLDVQGVNVTKRESERDSDALRAASDSTDVPQPGDLMFFRGVGPGAVGMYTMLYLGPGAAASHGICLGVMDSKHPLQIVDAAWLERPPEADVFLGYRRPKY